MPRTKVAIGMPYWNDRDIPAHLLQIECVLKDNVGSAPDLRGANKEADLHG